MPDRWGRPTPQDWMTMGSQALSMMNGMQQMQTRQEQRHYRNDVNTSLGVLGANREEGIDYATVNKPQSIRPDSWEYARELFIGNEGVMANLERLREGKEIKNLTNSILENPSILNDEKLFADFVEKKGGYKAYRAAEIAAGAMANIPETKQKIFENRMSFNASKFQNEIEPLKNQASRLLQAGKTNEAVPYLKELAKSLYGGKVEIEFDPNSQNIQLIQYDGENQGVASMNPQMLNEALEELTVEQYAREMAMKGEAVHRLNLKSEYTPFKGKDGQVYMVKAIYDPLNPEAGQKFAVIPEKGGQQQFFESQEELAQMGIYPENLERTQKQAEISTEQQKGNKEYWHGQKYKAEAWSELNQKASPSSRKPEEWEAVIKQAVSKARDMGLPVMVDQTTGNIASQKPLTKEQALRFKEFLNANGLNPDFDVQVDKKMFGRDKNEFHVIGITPLVTQFNIPEGKPDGKQDPPPGGEPDPDGDQEENKDFKKLRDQIVKEHLSQYKPQSRGHYDRQDISQYDLPPEKPQGKEKRWGGILGGDNSNFDVDPAEIDKNRDGVPDYLENIYNKKTNPRAASFLY